MFFLVRVSLYRAFSCKSHAATQARLLLLERPYGTTSLREPSNDFWRKACYQQSQENNENKSQENNENKAAPRPSSNVSPPDPKTSEKIWLAAAVVRRIDHLDGNAGGFVAQIGDPQELLLHPRQWRPPILAHQLIPSADTAGTSRSMRKNGGIRVRF